MILRRASALAAVILLAGGIGLPGQSQPAARGVFPETEEIQKAERIADPSARLKELLRIKSAHPGSAQTARIDSDILETRIDLASTVDVILALQKASLGKGRGTARMTDYVRAAARILDHPRRPAFGASRVLEAVLDYRARAERAASDPETFVSMPDPEDRKRFTARAFGDFSILVARAEAFAGNGREAVAALEAYRDGGGEAGPDYFDACGDACIALGRVRDAYDFYMSAAVKSYSNAAVKARAAFVLMYGSADGFDAALERLLNALPFRPEPLVPPKRWRGKTVLIEVFTNSENPLCLASDLAVGGLIDSYPARYLAILEYHVSLPRSDPFSNTAAGTRREQYRIASTPAAVIDGGVRIFGGGTRSMAGTLFKRYKSEIDAWLPEEPDLKLRASAVRTGDRVEAEISFNRERPGAEHYLALVEARVRWKGSSGTIIHKLIVRDLVRVDPSRKRTFAFDLAGIERAAGTFLTGPGPSDAGAANTESALRPPRIDREGLQVVYFVQDTGSRRILNAAVADVKPK